MADFFIASFNGSNGMPKLNIFFGWATIGQIIEWPNIIWPFCVFASPQEAQLRFKNNFFFHLMISKDEPA